MNIASKRNLILCIAFGLAVCGRWRILLLAVLIYVLLGGHGEPGDTMHPKIREYATKYLDRDEANHYLQAFTVLEQLDGRFSDDRVRAAKLRTLNQMLYNIPMGDKDEAEWLDIKREYANKDKTASAHRHV